ncbi:hypothetical protein Tco_0550890 [Tanacetum coccineum]
MLSLRKGFERSTSTPSSKPEQSGVVEETKPRTYSLMQLATILSQLLHSLYFFCRTIATAMLYSKQINHIPTHEKTAITHHIMTKTAIKQPSHLGCTCYLTEIGENLDKMKRIKGFMHLEDTPTQSRVRVYNKRTRLIVESIHLIFDEFKEMSETSIANDTFRLVPQRSKGDRL